MVKRRRRIKWAIVTQTRYVTRNGKLAWTYDRDEADDRATMIPGAKVVDAEEFVKQWRRKRGGR